MKALVLGAGVVGLTTAWALTEDGWDVVVVDRNPAPGGDASPGNGAQLSYSHVAPFASPETLRHMPAMLLQRNGPVRMRPGFDWDFLRWGLAFLRQCTSGAVARTTVAQLALGASSRAEMERLMGTLPLDFGLREAGKLVVHRDAAAFAAARRQVARQATLGAEQSVLGPRACLDLEPGLRISESALAGGIYTAADQVGDCAAFCRDLAGVLRTRNTVEWRLSEPCTPEVRAGRLVGVRIGADLVEADETVLCLGAGAPAFARAAGVRLPIVPMKGYSLTVTPRTGLSHSVTDAARKVVFAPLRDGEVRVAGIADFVGQDRTLDPARVGVVVQATRESLDLDAAEDMRPWTGLRPVTPDSRPLIGPSGLPGLFLNTGHGGLGWTLAAGSARLAADMLAGAPTEVDAGAFALAR